MDLNKSNISFFINEDCNRKCCVGGCSVNKKLHPNIVLYPLPADAQLKKYWLKFIHSTGADTKDQKLFVCALHFSSSTAVLVSHQKSNSHTRKDSVIIASKAWPSTCQQLIPRLNISSLACHTTAWKLFLKRKKVIPVIKRHSFCNKLPFSRQTKRLRASCNKRKVPGKSRRTVN